MRKGKTQEVPIVTVIGSHTGAMPNGGVAIVLETKEKGPIGFLVDLPACGQLRREIANAESFLRQKIGQA